MTFLMKLYIHFLFQIIKTKILKSLFETKCKLKKFLKTKEKRKD